MAIIDDRKKGKYDKGINGKILANWLRKRCAQSNVNELCNWASLVDGQIAIYGTTATKVLGLLVVMVVVSWEQDGQGKGLVQKKSRTVPDK